MAYRYRVKGPSLTKELVWANALFANEHSNQQPVTIINNLLAYANKPWQSFVDGGLSNQTGRFDFPTVWQAIEQVAHTANLHRRQVEATRGLEVGAFGDASGIVLLSPDMVTPNLALNERIGVITAVRLLEESTEVWNRIIPLGQGEGNNLWTMKYTTRTSPYLPQSNIGPNGERYYYIQDDLSINRYGLRVRPVVYKDVAPISQSVLGFELSSNALYDLGKADLLRARQPRMTLGVDVADIRQHFMVGDTMRVVWNGIVDDGSPTQALTKTLYPRANGYHQEWIDDFWSHPSADAWSLVDETTTDNDSTYVAQDTAAGGGKHITFLFPASGAVGNITSVQIVLRARRTGTGNVEIAPVLRQNDTTWAPIATPITATYANYTTTLTTNPITGREWTIEDLELIDAGALLAQNIVGDQIRLTGVWLVVNYAVGGRRAYRSVDEDFVVMEKKRTVRDDGSRRWQLTLSNIASWRTTNEELVVGAIEDLFLFRTAVKPYTFQVDHGSERDSIQASGSHWFTYDIAYDANIHAVLAVKLNVQLSGVKSNVQEAAQGQISTSSGGGSHSHSVGSSTSSSDGTHGHTLVVTNTGGPAHNAYNGGRTWYAEDWSPGSWHFHALLDSHHHFYGGGATVTYQGHSHTVQAQTSTTSGNHTHTVPAHDHALVYGIFQSNRPSSPAVQVWINSTDRTAALGGPWNSDFTVDITQYLVDTQGRPAWGTNRVQFRKPATSPDFIDLIAHGTSLVVATALAPV